MKHLIVTTLLATAVPALANHPDSVYVRPDVMNGRRDMQIAYSVDKKHWTHIQCNLFESDYGAWGSGKKLHYPVLSYDGKMYHATFIPDLKQPQLATTSSADFALWKPQDYPYYSGEEFKSILEKQKAASENNIITIPYSGLEALMNKQRRAARNAEMDNENFIAKGQEIEKATKISTTLTLNPSDRKDISGDLLGIFFEDISYAADGGLYAELIQNRDFEYTSADHKDWNSFTGWSVIGEDGGMVIDKKDPISQNNAVNFKIKVSKPNAIRIINKGWDGIPLKAKAKYNFSMFLKGKGKMQVSLVDGDKTLAQCVVSGNEGWKQYKAVLVPNADAKEAQLEIVPLSTGDFALDFVSLFPQDTYKGRPNGLRKDLAETIADLHPRFVRFPGGCATHGQGIDNIYHWQATVGDLWDRQGDMNIWSYHQTRGLGFYEYFQYCEDIGAEPLPVLAAGVPCQNSWKGGSGQQGGIPFEKDLNGKPSPYKYNGKDLTMESYLQELLDLIEWANGDAKTSKLAQIRAKAGHPKPFNMKYLGIGNEDLISDVFLERYHFLIDGVKKAHPEITIVGTVGPFWEGSDYEFGWKDAKEKNIDVVDEHYYNPIGWYFNHRDFYDNYDRNGTKVYLGEWASKGNRVVNALVEAAYLTNVERNADVVVMSSYAPLLAKEKHTNWNPDLIYFNNTEIKPTANYYVQRAFGQNGGQEYIYSSLNTKVETAEGVNVNKHEVDRRLDKSVVIDKKTGDMIIKIVNILPKEADVTLDLGDVAKDYATSGELQLLATNGDPSRSNEWEVNETKQVSIASAITLPKYSFSVIRLKKSKK